jgi:hypothetical protein
MIQVGETGTNQPIGWWMREMVHLVEWELAGEAEVLRENLPHCHSIRHKSHTNWLGTELGCHGDKPVTNHLGCDMTQLMGAISFNCFLKINPNYYQRSFHYILCIQHDMDCTENIISNSYIAAYVFSATGTCLPRHCLATAVSSGFNIVMGTSHTHTEKQGDLITLYFLKIRKVG